LDLKTSINKKKYFGSNFFSKLQKNNPIQNGVNIQDAAIRPSEPCLFAIFKPTIFKFWILIGDYIKINHIFGFLDLLSISSEICMKICS
jgi:hypothetical protein